MDLTVSHVSYETSTIAPKKVLLPFCSPTRTRSFLRIENQEAAIIYFQSLNLMAQRTSLGNLLKWWLLGWGDSRASLPHLYSVIQDPSLVIHNMKTLFPKPKLSTPSFNFITSTNTNTFKFSNIKLQWGLIKKRKKKLKSLKSSWSRWKGSTQGSVDFIGLRIHPDLTFPSNFKCPTLRNMMETVVPLAYLECMVWSWPKVEMMTST